MPFAVQNMGATNQTFTIMVPDVAVGFESATYVASSYSITLQDANGDGSATLSSVPGTPIYQADVNGTPVLDLGTDPSSISCTPAGCVDVIFEGPVSGTFGQVFANTIGLTLNFQLSPGDSAGGVARFEVREVPEPGTALMIGGGMALLGAGARRRR